MFKNNSGKSVKFEGDARLSSEGKNNDSLIDASRPLSLTMSPTLIWLNAIGNVEAQAITAAWQPQFRVTWVSRQEMDTW